MVVRISLPGGCHCLLQLLTLGAHVQEGYSSLFVCLCVCLLQLAWLTWRLKLWNLDTSFKLSQFRKELFGQELRCDLFVTLAR